MKGQIEKALMNDGKIVITEMKVGGIAGSLKPRYVPWDGKHLPNGDVDFKEGVSAVEADKLKNDYGKIFEGNGIKEHIFKNLPGHSEMMHGPLSLKQKNEGTSIFFEFEYDYARHKQILAAKKIVWERMDRDTLPDKMFLTLFGFGSFEVARISNQTSKYIGIVKVDGMPEGKTLAIDYARPVNDWPPQKKEPSLSWRAGQVVIKQEPLITKVNL